MNLFSLSKFLDVQKISTWDANEIAQSENLLKRMNRVLIEYEREIIQDFMQKELWMS